jgi:hypothetical protein
MQAITTRYLSPTTYRGARVKATAGKDRETVTIPYSYGCDQRTDQDAHAQAAVLLARTLGWPGRLVCGEVEPGHKVWVYVQPDEIFDTESAVIIRRRGKMVRVRVIASDNAGGMPPARR